MSEDQAAGDDLTPRGDLTLWRIEPVLDPADDAWQDRAIWSEIVVAAESAAFARLAAERRALSAPWVPVGNESESRRAGLNDEKLYRVVALPVEQRASYPANLRPGEILSMRVLCPPRRR
jgi:hypothetical protein